MFETHFDVTISPNRLRLTNRNTGETAERAAEFRYSSDKELVAQDEFLEEEFRSLLQPWKPKPPAFVRFLIPGASNLFFPIAHVVVKG